MKIAVPTMDGTSISAHFGKSKAFLVFECEGGEIRGRELRENDQHKAHDPGGECQGHSASVLHDPFGEHAHQHDHRGFARAICGRSGAGDQQTADPGWARSR